MLDAIAQTLVEQAATVPSANVNHPQAARVASSQAPTLKPTVSAPETIQPTPQATRRASSQFTTSSHSQPTNAPSTAKSAQPLSATTKQLTQPTPVDANRSQALEQATANQRLLLKQRLAELVAKEKPLKESLLRTNLEATAIALAQAGQFAQARQMAQDAMLLPEVQANLLAQIDAIAAKRPFTRPTITQLAIVTKPVLPSPLVKGKAVKGKAWAPVGLGRSLPLVPSVLPSVLSQASQYSYIPPATQQYVSYAINGFGRAIGGIGVVIDGNTPDFSGQNWTAIDAVSNGLNAELWNGLSFIFPLAVPAPITSGFGWRVHPIRGDRRFHSGTDLGAPMGTPVLAAADGKVVLADQLGGYGLAIILSHRSDTRETLYGHLSALLVKPGQWVEKGTVIGRVGSTGLSTGPHLHFELRQKTSSGWQAIDPGVPLKSALARLVKALQSG